MHPKSISPARDRLQSNGLVWIAAPILLLLALWRLSTTTLFPFRFAIASLRAVIISVSFAVLVRSVRAATIPAAFCGAQICLILTLTGGTPAHSGLPALGLLFVLTFAATRLGRARKESRGLAEPRTGRRASQVIANLGVAGVCAALSRFYPGITIAMLAALTEATADTVSSEIGQAFGGTPRMLTSLRPVPSGTDGAITLTGTAAGVVAATLVAASSVGTMGVSPAQAVVALTSGIAGLFFDSLLGATVERRSWINNDLVNVASTAFAAALALWGFHYLPHQ